MHCANAPEDRVIKQESGKRKRGRGAPLFILDFEAGSALRAPGASALPASAGLQIQRQ